MSAPEVILSPEWREKLVKLENGEITREEYDRWRYYYPKLGATLIGEPSKMTDLMEPIAATRIENKGPDKYVLGDVCQKFENMLKE